jgi:TP901 family phage tail tape measure protein
MPTISLIFDAAGASQGAAEYERSAERIDRAAKRMETQLRRVSEVQRTSSGVAQAASAQVAAVERTATAHTRAAASLAQEEAALRRRINAGLTALSTLGGENRAYAQLTRDSLRRSHALGQETNAAQTMAAVNAQLARSAALPAQVFATAAVNSRDLRLNMLQLQQAMVLLGGSFGSFAPTALNLFTGISRAIQEARHEVVQFIAQSKIAQLSLGAQAAAGAGGGASAFAVGAAASAPSLATRGLAAAGAFPGGVAGLAGATATSIALGKLVAVSNDVERAFDEVSAITGIVGRDLDALTLTAIRFASETTQSTTEVAEAFKLVASASPELIGTAGGLESVTRAAILLSEASGDDLRSSVTAVSTALAQFGLDASEAARVVDLLAAGSRIGSVEVPQLGEALSRTGSVARAAGISIEELVATIETAGKSKQPLDIIETSLRNIILRLQTSGRLTQGESLLSALREVESQGLSTAAMVKLFGERTITTAQFLLQNLGTLEKYSESVRETGVASDQASIRLDNVSGAADRFGAAFGALVAGISQTGPIKTAADVLQGLIDKLAAGLELAAKFVTQPAPNPLIGLGGQPITFGGGPGKVTTPAEENARLIEQAAKLRDLETQYDKVKTAGLAFAIVEADLNRLRADGLITEQRRIELLALARAATVEATKSYKDVAKATTEAERSQAAWNEEIRKTALSQQEAFATSEQRLLSIDAENEILRRQIEVASQGKDAIAALAGELAAEEAELRRIREIGGPLTEEDVQRVRDAAQANKELTSALQVTTAEAQRLQQAYEQPFLNAAENIQRAFGDMFTDIIRNGIDSFEDLGDAILDDIFARLAGEIATLLIFQPVLQGIGGSSSSGGLLDSLFGGGGGGIVSPALGATGLPATASLDEVVAALRGGVEEGAETGTRSGIGALKDLLGLFSGGGGGGLSFFGGGGGGGGSLLGGASQILGGAAFGIGAGLLANSLGANANLSAIVGVLGASLIPTVLEAATLGAQLLIAGYTTGGVAGIGAAAGTAGGLSAGVLSSASVPVVGWIAAGILGAIQGIPAGAELASAKTNPVAGLSPWIAGRNTAFSTYSLSSAITAATVATFDNDVPRFGFDFATQAPGTSPTGVEQAGPFGTLAFTGGHRLKEPQAGELLNAIVAFDTAIAAVLNPEEIEKATAQLAQNIGPQSFLVSTRHRGKYVTEAFNDLVAGRIGQIFEAIEGAGFGAAFVGRAEFSNADQFGPLIEEFLNARGQFQASIRTLSGEEIPQFEVALAQLSNAFTTAREAAAPFGLDISKLTDAFETGRQKLGTDFADVLELRQLSRTDPLAALLITQQKEADKLFAEARFLDAQLGLNTIVAAEREAAAERLAIIEEFTARANAPLQSLRDALTVGDLGGLSSPARLAEARSRFETERAEAFERPFDPTERAEFASAAQIFVELLREVEASGPRFAEGVDLARTSIDALLATPLTGGPVALAAGAANDTLQQQQLDAQLDANATQADTLAELESLRGQVIALTTTVANLSTQIEQLVAGQS